MNRSSLTALLTARWLLLHLVFVAAVVATGFLAWWQWDRAHAAGGSFQNLGYALQWPMFGAFTLFLWYRVARMHIQESHGPEGADTQDPDGQHAETQHAAGGAGLNHAGSIEPGELGESSRRRLVPKPAAPVDSEQDPEMAAYNRYLTELNEADEADEVAPTPEGRDENGAHVDRPERTRSS